MNRTVSARAPYLAQQVGADKGSIVVTAADPSSGILGRCQMNRLTVMAMIFCSSLVVLALLPKVMADEWNKKTIVTFDHEVEIPGGKVLPAGRYVFKLLDSGSNRNIVQIFNEDQTHLYASILAIPNYRLQPTDETVMTFRARAAGSAEAIRAWFYPGANWGQEFVYPKTRAVKVAKVTNKPAPSMPSELASKITMPAKSVNKPPIMALKKAPLKAVKPTEEVVALGEVVALKEITVWDPVQVRPEASLVVDPTSSMNIQTMRLHQARLLKVRIVVAIIVALILTALVGFARSLRSAYRRRGTAKVAPPGLPHLRRSSQKGGRKAA